MADTTVASSSVITRWQAAGIHLLISVAIAAVVLFVMLRIWYPPPLFMAEGGNDLLFLLVAVDVVLGPLITLIIFKSGKPSLRFDLTIIALIQACALVYGCHVMFVARPVFIAFMIDRFETVRANDIDPADLPQAKYPALRSLALTGPVTIAVDMPKDLAALRELMAEVQKGGKPAQHQPKYYVPYAERRQIAVEQCQPLEPALKRGGDFAQLAQAFLAASGRPASTLKFLPLQTRRGFGAVLLDAKTGDIVTLLPPRL